MGCAVPSCLTYLGYLSPVQFSSMAFGHPGFYGASGAMLWCLNTCCWKTIFIFLNFNIFQMEVTRVTSAGHGWCERHTGQEDGLLAPGGFRPEKGFHFDQKGSKRINLLWIWPKTGWVLARLQKFGSSFGTAPGAAPRRAAARPDGALQRSHIGCRLRAGGVRHPAGGQGAEKREVFGPFLVGQKYGDVGQMTQLFWITWYFVLSLYIKTKMISDVWHLVPLHFVIASIVSPIREQLSRPVESGVMSKILCCEQDTFFAFQTPAELYRTEGKRAKS